MASNIYIKSIIWLVSLGGLGYGLMIVTEPSHNKISQIRNTTSKSQLSAEEKKKFFFLERLKEATSNTNTKSNNCTDKTEN